MQEEIVKQAVISSLGGGYGRIKKLLHDSGSWEKALLALPDAPKPMEEWRTLADVGIQFVSREHPDFPQQLLEIPKPPFGIYVRGELPKAPCISIVGTRKTTQLGKQFAYTLAKRLADAGIVVVSGLAFGIDSAAHRGALKNGQTIAVLVGGADKISPRSQQQLGEHILEQGAIVSEYPPGSPVYKPHFLARNRIISGLSLGTIIVEAPEKSGALSTAQHAKKQGRDVFAVPGPYNHKNYHGNHRLIRQGAILVSSPNQLLEHYGSVANKQQQLPVSQKLNKEERGLLNLLESSTEGLDRDTLLRNTSLDPPRLNQLLSMLVLNGHIVEQGGRYFIC